MDTADVVEISTREVCPMMATALAALVNHTTLAISDPRTAMAMAALGHAMLAEAGADLQDEAVMAAVSMLSGAFIVAMEARNAKCAEEVEE